MLLLVESLPAEDRAKVRVLRINHFHSVKQWHSFYGALHQAGVLSAWQYDRSLPGVLSFTDLSSSKPLIFLTQHLLPKELELTVTQSVAINPEIAPSDPSCYVRRT